MARTERNSVCRMFHLLTLKMSPYCPPASFQFSDGLQKSPCVLWAPQKVSGFFESFVVFKGYHYNRALVLFA